MTPVPVNVVTGFAGTGKSTAILHLLNDSTDRWAVLLNELGGVSIDPVLLAERGVAVRSVGSGCVCCTTTPHLQVALHLLLSEAKPTRLLIEANGLGHPAKLIEMLKVQYRDRLDVRATICMAALNDAVDPAMRCNANFLNHVEAADVLVLNRRDEASPEQVRAFAAWANALIPPKQLIAAVEQGRIDKTWLDLV